MDLNSLVGIVVPQIYLTRELRALGLDARQVGKAQRDPDAPRGVQLVPDSPRLFLRAEVDDYVSENARCSVCRLRNKRGGLIFGMRISN